METPHSGPTHPAPSQPPWLFLGWLHPPQQWPALSTSFPEVKCVPPLSPDREVPWLGWLLALHAPRHRIWLGRAGVTKAAIPLMAHLHCHVSCRLGRYHRKVWNDKEIANLSDRAWLSVQLLPFTAALYTCMPLDSFPGCLTPRVSRNAPPLHLGSSHLLLR